MKLDERVRERLKALIEKGEAVLQTQQPGGGLGSPPIVDLQRYMEWRSQARECLRQVCGPDHNYTKDFQSTVTDRQYSGCVQAGLGILHGALEDVEQGNLRLRDLVVAEVFSDFLEQAQHLLENGYKNPAASLAGAVLENGLRSLAKRKGILTKDTDNLATLNQKIAQKGIYNRVRQGEVAAWTNVRNAADHGRFDDLTEPQVDALIKGVRDFLAAEL